MFVAPFALAWLWVGAAPLAVEPAVEPAVEEAPGDAVELGEPFDQARRARLGVAADAVGRPADRGDRAGRGAEAVERGREVGERAAAQPQPRPDRRLVAAVLYGEGRLVISHPVCFGEEG